MEGAEYQIVILLSAITAAKRRYFPDRTYQWLLHDIADQVEPQDLLALRAYLAGDAPNAKQDDALALVAAMRAAATPNGSNGQK